MGTRWPLVHAYLQLSVVDELLWRFSSFYKRNRCEYWARIFVVLAASRLASDFRWPCDVVAGHDSLADIPLRVVEAKILDSCWLCSRFNWCPLYSAGAHSNFAIPKTTIRQICRRGVRIEHSMIQAWISSVTCGVDVVV